MLVHLALLLAVIQCLVSWADASYGLDTALNQAYKLDPLAKNDTFELLKPSLRNALSSPSTDVFQKLQALQILQTTTPVTVKLVGFSNDQKHQLELQLSRYLEVLNKNEQVHVIGGEGGSHELRVRSKIEMEVVRAGNTLADKIFKAIQSALDDKPSSSSSFSSIYHQPVPYTVVDNIVRADLENPLGSYFIYILNLKRQDKSYAYDYQPDVTDTFQAFSKCLGNFWTGRERYLWFDLAAGPVEYGPSLSGEGLIIRTEYPYAAAFHGESPVQKSLLADLASLLWSASQMLLAPPIRVPIYFDSHLEVHFYHIDNSAADDDKKVKWEEIERSFLTEADGGLLLRGQTLTFKRFTISYDACAVCAAMLSRSTKSFSSRVFLERYSLFVNEYIDSKQLHYLLQDNAPELEMLASAHAGGESRYWGRVVPVYIFDVNTERVLMLDRSHQAVAFRDMVISIRTRSYQTMSEFTCNSRPTVVRTREIERAVVGSLLQTLWGVTPTHVTWSKQHNSTIVDYTWSLGRTPFGPFSDLSSLSFVQRDAAPRNLLYSMLNMSLWGASDVLHTMASMGGEKLLLGRSQQADMNKRWNFFTYKLNKAASAISHFDFNSALFFIKSAEHDLYAVHSLVYKASSHLEASINCFTKPPFPWPWLLFALISAALGLYIWFRREQLFSSKRKRF